MGVPQNGMLLREHIMKMDDDWGYTHLWKHPYGIWWENIGFHELENGGFMVFHSKMGGKNGTVV